MRLAQQLTFRFAKLGASYENVCLFGESPTSSVPALGGCEGLYGDTTTAMHSWLHDMSTPTLPGTALLGIDRRTVYVLL